MRAARQNVDRCLHAGLPSWHLFVCRHARALLYLSLLSSLASCASTPSHFHDATCTHRVETFSPPCPPQNSCYHHHVPTYLPIWPNSLTSFPLLFAFLLCHTSLGRFYIQSQHACIMRGLLESPGRFGGRLVSRFWARLILVIFTHAHTTTPPRELRWRFYTTFQGVAGWREKLLYTLGSVNLFIHVRIVFLGQSKPSVGTHDANSREAV